MWEFRSSLLWQPRGYAAAEQSCLQKKLENFGLESADFGLEDADLDRKFAGFDLTFAGLHIAGLHEKLENFDLEVADFDLKFAGFDLSFAGLHVAGSGWRRWSSEDQTSCNPTAASRNPNRSWGSTWSCGCPCTRCH